MVVLAVSAEILFIDDAYLHIVDGGRMIDRRGTIREDLQHHQCGQLAFERSSVASSAIDGRSLTEYRSVEPG